MLSACKCCNLSSKLCFALMIVSTTMGVSTGVAMQHSKFTAKTEMRFVAGLRRMGVRCDNKLSFASWCSGTGIDCHVLAALHAFWYDAYGVWLPCDHVSFCESSPPVQEHLKRQFPNVPIFEDLLAAAESGRGRDVVSNTELPLSTTARAFIAGFSCASRSPKNMKAKDNVSCIQIVGR